MVVMTASNMQMSLECAYRVGSLSRKVNYVAVFAWMWCLEIYQKTWKNHGILHVMFRWSGSSFYFLVGNIRNAEKVKSDHV